MSIRRTVMQSLKAEVGPLRILALGPVRGMATGQQQAFSVYVQGSTHDLKVVDFGTGSGGIGTRCVIAAFAVLEVAAQITFFRPDRIYLTTSRSLPGWLKDAFVLLLARARNIPVVNHLHGNDFAAFRDRCSPLTRRLLDYSYKSVAVSIVLAKGMEHHYHPYSAWMRLCVVPNCIAFTTEDLRSPMVGEENGIRILFLSNLIRSKGLMELIAGITEIQCSDPSVVVELRIAGSLVGGEIGRGELDRAISHLRDARYVGPVDKAGKLKLLRWANTLALPSYYSAEAAPLSIIEGLAMGCLIIASPNGYLPELLLGTVHLSVEAKNSSAVASALRCLSREPELFARARQINPDVATRRFSRSRYIDAIDLCVERLL